MIELLGVSLLLFVLIGVPLLIVMGGLLAMTTVKQWFKLQTARLQLDRDRFEHELELRKLTAEIPPWIDVRDPLELSAWRSAVREANATAMVRMREA